MDSWTLEEKSLVSRFCTFICRDLFLQIKLGSKSMKTDWGYSERFPFNPNCLHWCNSVQLPNTATGQHSSPESLKGCWVSLMLYIKAAECTRLCAASFQQKELSCLRRSNDVTVSRFRQKHVCRMYAIYRLHCARHLLAVLWLILLKETNVTVVKHFAAV